MRTEKQIKKLIAMHKVEILEIAEDKQHQKDVVAHVHSDSILKMNRLENETTALLWVLGDGRIYNDMEHITFKSIR